MEYGLASNSYLRFYLAPKVKSCIFLLLDMPADPMARLVMRNEGLHGASDAMVCKTTLWHELKVGITA